MQGDNVIAFYMVGFFLWTILLLKSTQSANILFYSDNPEKIYEKFCLKQIQGREANRAHQKLNGSKRTHNWIFQYL